MNKFLFILSIISFGGIAINTQSLFIREFLAIFLGSELNIGLLFCFWFFSIVLGAWLAGLLLQRSKFLIDYYSIILSLMSIISICQLALIRLSRIIFNIGIGQYAPFEKTAIISFCIVFPFSFLVGFNFPIASQKWIEEINKSINIHPAKIIGNVYLYEALGSVIAGCLLAFLLISKLTNFQIVFIWAFVVSLSSSLLLIAERLNFPDVKNRKIILSSLILLLIASCLFCGFYKKIDYYSAKKRWISTAGDVKFIKSIDTKYQNFSIGKRENILIIYSNGEFLGNFPDYYQGAYEANLSMIQNPFAKDLLILGFGAENLLPEILKYPIRAIDYVVIDPEYIKIIKQYFPTELSNLLNNPKIKIFIEDGIYYLNHCKKKYDIIIIKQPDPINANINRYYTFEFYAKVKKIMKKDSFLITSSASSINYFSEEALNYVNSLFYTLKSIFSYVTAAPGERALFFATNDNSSLTLNYKTLSQRYEKLNIKSKHFSKYHFQFLLEPERVSWITNLLNNKNKEGIINKNEKPSSFYLNLILWQKYSSRQLSSFLDKIQKINLFFLLLIPISAMLFFRTIAPLIIRNKKKIKRFDILFGIFSIGFTGISLELLLLYAFQSHYGYLYQIISLLIALFMIGLVFGSYLGNKIIEIKKLNITAAALICIILLIIELIVFIKFYEEINKYIYGLLMTFAGIFSGSFFPISNKIYISQGATSELSASKTDSIDHLGACLGSLTVGCFLIPLLNIYETVLFLIFLLFAAAYPFFFCLPIKKENKFGKI